SGGGPPRRAATGGGIDVSTRRCPPAGGNRPFGAGPGRVGMDGGPAPAGAAGACGHAGPGGCGPAGPGPGGAGLAGGHLGVPRPLAGSADPAGRRGLERPQRGVRDVGRKKWWWALAVAAVVIAAAAFTGLGERVASRLAGGRVQEAGVADLPTITVRQGDIVRTITATGNVQPARLVDLRLGTGGRVQEVRVAPGQRVEAGEVLAVLDNRQQELAYFQARNAYEVARIDGAPNTVREREIDMQLAQEALEQTYLRAPFAGVVTQGLVDPGQTVNTDEAVVQLMDDTVFQVEVAVDELDIGQVQPGQPAAIRLDADPGRVRSGVVKEVSLVA